MFCVGNWLITASSRGRIRIWKLASWLDSHNNPRELEAQLEAGVDLESEVELYREIKCHGSLLPGSSSSANANEDVVAIHSLKFNSTGSIGVFANSIGEIWSLQATLSTDPGSSSIPEKLSRLIGSNAPTGSIIEVKAEPKRMMFDWFCTLDEANSLMIWKTDTLEPLTIPLSCGSSSSTSLAFTNYYLNETWYLLCAVGFANGFIQIYDANQLTLVTSFQSHESRVTCMTFGPGTSFLVSGDADGFVYVTQARTGLTLHVLREHVGADISSLEAEQPDSSHSLLLIASKDLRASLWMVDWKCDEFELIDWMTFPTGPVQATNCCDFVAKFSTSNANEIFFTGVWESVPSLVIYNLKSRKRVRSIRLVRWPTLIYPLLPYNRATVSVSDLMALGCQDGVLQIIDLQTGSFQDYVGHASGLGPIKSIMQTRRRIISLKSGENGNGGNEPLVEEREEHLLLTTNASQIIVWKLT